MLSINEHKFSILKVSGSISFPYESIWGSNVLFSLAWRSKENCKRLNYSFNDLEKNLILHSHIITDFLFQPGRRVFKEILQQRKAVQHVLDDCVARGHTCISGKLWHVVLYYVRCSMCIQSTSSLSCARKVCESSYPLYCTGSNWITNTIRLRCRHYLLPINSNYVF